MTEGSRLAGGISGVRRRTIVLFALMAAGVAFIAVTLQPVFAATVPPPMAGFNIKRQAPYTRSTHVTVGDDGWTPFFSPAVLVWDGGSIIGGSGGSPGMDYASQTLRLLPHPCLSYGSSSGHALIADMIAEAPLEVDARYDQTADADICLVMAGGGDILAGHDVGVIFDDLQRYCLDRRAAGFRVVVLTLLPRSTPDHFESDRLVLNALIRDEWPTFADGLADLAADGRIGDAMDNLNTMYYSLDGLHLTDAGYAVMAAVTAPVLNALAWRSDQCDLRLSNDGESWTDWHPYAANTLWRLANGDGTKTVYAQYRNRLGDEALLWDTIELDTVKPVTFALRNATVTRGRLATLAYLVTDSQPCGPTADVTIAVRDRAGALRAKLVYPARSIDVPHYPSFRCRLAKGVYRFFVYARDTAGNQQSSAGVARLTVK